MTYRANARAAAQRDPEILAQSQQTLRSITPHDAMDMARLRGPAQLPYWSRLAIGEFHRQGVTQVELAANFECSRRTVVNVIGGGGRTYSPLSGARILTAGQQLPPGRFRHRPVPRESAAAPLDVESLECHARVRVPKCHGYSERAGTLAVAK